MTEKNKIFIILPDGVGLRNFVYSGFNQTGRTMGFESILWNALPVEFSDFDIREIKLSGKPAAKTDLLKRTLIDLRLAAFEKQTGNPVFSEYRFLPANKTAKQKIKNGLLRFYIFRYQNNLTALRKSLLESERKTQYYRQCRKTLKIEQPKLVFCTNQRPVNAIAPLTAAQDLGIPTATFIFSWDNLPKATIVVETDYYFVWSAHMKNELLFYYPHIKASQIMVTGTPQFEMHFDESLRQSREAFCREHQLDPQKKYICFSGDDVTTSPHDPHYLRDVAEVIRSLNNEKDQWRILFRRCPVDFSGRYDPVLKKYKEEITALDPKWNKTGEAWNTVLPDKEDNALLVNTVAHCELVINVGSSMVFDAVCHGNPTAYIHYNPEGVPLQKDIHTIYKYIHFQSMPKQPAVYWINKADELSTILSTLETSKEPVVEAAQHWFKTINQHPPQKASERIWEKICNILEK